MTCLFACAGVRPRDKSLCT